MGQFTERLKKWARAGKAAKDVLTGKVDYNATSVPVFNEMNEQQQVEFLLRSIDKDFITAIQLISLIYRNPKLKHTVACALRDEIVAAQGKEAK